MVNVFKSQQVFVSFKDADAAEISTLELRRLH